MAKSEDLAPTNALERTRCDQAHCPQAKGARSSACLVSRKARVALATIASPTAPWVFKAVTCARAHRLAIE
jgi:hypothetical protein